jgi:hypothetical protein
MRKARLFACLTSEARTEFDEIFCWSVCTPRCGACIILLESVQSLTFYNSSTNKNFAFLKNEETHEKYCYLTECAHTDDW